LITKTAVWPMSRVSVQWLAGGVQDRRRADSMSSPRFPTLSLEGRLTLYHKRGARPLQREVGGAGALQRAAAGRVLRPPRPASAGPRTRPAVDKTATLTYPEQY